MKKIPYLYILFGLLAVYVGWQGSNFINFVNLFFGGFLISWGVMNLRKQN